MRSILGRSLLVVALAGAACRTMKSVSLDELNALNPDRAWVTDTDQSVVVVSVPLVMGDTLAGYVDGQLLRLRSTELRQVTVLSPAPARTALLVAGVTAGVAGFLVALANTNHDQPNASPPDCYTNINDPACRHTQGTP